MYLCVFGYTITVLIKWREKLPGRYSDGYYFAFSGHSRKGKSLSGMALAPQAERIFDVATLLTRSPGISLVAPRPKIYIQFSAMPWMDLRYAVRETRSGFNRGLSST
jgi:hypothetical protein